MAADRLRERIAFLVDKWRRRAKAHAEAGASSDDPVGRRVMEHGTACYRNCAQDLEDAVANADDPSNQPTPTKK